jgi:prepilin-type N-terminal cleavage/methylation domain-containing protein
MMITRRHDRGFTLIELVVAVAIFVTMVVVAMPVFTNTINKRRLNGAVERVATDLRYVQSQAVARNGTFRLHFGNDPAAGKPGQYRLEQNVGGANPWSPLNDWYTLSRDYLGATLQGIADSPPTSVTLYEVRFGPQGSVTNTGAITYPILLTVAKPSLSTLTIKVMRSGPIRIP